MIATFFSTPNFIPSPSPSYATSSRDDTVSSAKLTNSFFLFSISFFFLFLFSLPVWVCGLVLFLFSSCFPICREKRKRTTKRREKKSQAIQSAWLNRHVPSILIVNNSPLTAFATDSQSRSFPPFFYPKDHHLLLPALILFLF